MFSGGTNFRSISIQKLLSQCFSSKNRLAVFFVEVRTQRGFTVIAPL
jgi:hypothetical protein